MPLSAQPTGALALPRSRAGRARPAFALLLLVAACASTSATGSGATRATEAAADADGYVDLLRAEHRATEKMQALLTWYEATRGEAFPAGALAPPDPVATSMAQEALARAHERTSAGSREALALRFLLKALAQESLRRATAPFDRELSAAEVSATLELPFEAGPIAYRDAPLRLAQETDPARRAEIYAAVSGVISAALDPILTRREAAAQAAARAAGYQDYVALAEELREVDLHRLLAEGARYVRATEAPFRAALDRVAREELGIPRERLRAADLPRLSKAPSLAPYFAPARELAALSSFLGGFGLSLRTAAGTSVRVDDGLFPLKRPRAFVQPVEAPADVRLSVKPAGGLDDYWALFHEAGHAVHFAEATIEPVELRTLGYAAPGEAFGELFRQAFADPRFLLRYRAFLAQSLAPVPGDAQLAAVLRRTALLEMMHLRRYAFAQIAWELRLHGRPLAELGPALALLPDPTRAAGDSEEALRELYRQLFSVAGARSLTADEAQRFRVDVDDAFYAADYARAFALAGLLEDGLRRRFGDGWSSEPAAGEFLRSQLFSAGTSLSTEQVLARLGLEPELDFGRAADRALRLLRAADALEGSSAPVAGADLASAAQAAVAQKASAGGRSVTIGP